MSSTRVNSKSDPLREVGLVLFGLGLAVIVAAYQNRIDGLGIIILLVGLGLMNVKAIWNWYTQATYAWRMRRRLRKPRVAILIHDTYPRENAGWAATRFGPNDWKQELSTAGLEARLIAADSDELEQFDLAINPYGERYVEEDPLNLSSLHRIRRFIEKGGWYCQCGGAGFYYGWDPIAERAVPLSPESETGELLQQAGRTFLVPRRWVGGYSLTNTPLWEHFGVNTTGGEKTVRISLDQTDAERRYAGNLLEGTQVPAVLEFRSARVEATKAMIPLVHADYQSDGLEQRFFPLILVPIGLGLMVYGGMDLKGDRNVLNPVPGEGNDVLTLNGLRLTCRALANLVNNASKKAFTLPIRRTWPKGDYMLDY